MVRKIYWFKIVSCESDKEKFERVARECAQKNSIENLELSLYGYSFKDANSVSIKIKRSGKIIACVNRIHQLEKENNYLHEINQRRKFQNLVQIVRYGKSK